MRPWQIFCVMWLTAASPVLAQDASDIAGALAHAGTFNTEEERGTVEVQDCVMTSYRWRNLPDHGWVLWTSIQFDMRQASLKPNPAAPDQYFAYMAAPDGEQETGFGIWGLTMEGNALARQERSVLREASQATTPSPRGDGTSHYFEYRSEFMISMEGVGAFEKMREFTNLYRRYVEDYCLLLG